MRPLIIAIAIATVAIACIMSFESTLFDRSFYKGEFKKLGIYESEGNFLPDNMTETVLLFYENKIPDLNLSYMTPAETSHMKGVKTRVRYAINIRRLLIGIWLVLVGLLLWRGNIANSLGRAYQASGIIMFIVIAVFGLIGLFFDQFFSVFHEVVFPEGNYLFPASSVLLRVYTFQLQFDVFLVTIFKSLLVGIVLLLIGKMLIAISKPHGH